MELVPWLAPVPDKRIPDNSPPDSTPGQVPPLTLFPLVYKSLPNKRRLIRVALSRICTWTFLGHKLL